MSDDVPHHDAYAALRLPGFRRYTLGSMLVGITGGAQGVAIGQAIFERTGRPLDLGYFGLIEALAMLAFIFPAGWLADRYDRRRVCQVTGFGSAVGSAVLGWMIYRELPVTTLYVVLFVRAAVMNLGQPARAALLPQIVPRDMLQNAVTWRTSTFQVSSITGPVLGGFMIWRFGAPSVFGLNTIFQLLFVALMFFVPLLSVERPTGGVKIDELTAGVRFVLRTPLLLTVMALDMFAVLLGGAVYLLPVFAADILGGGDQAELWLGILRAADAVGALCMALVLAHRPPMRRPGRALLLAVAGFGLATIVFGLSRWMWLSTLALFFVGVCDNISVVVRSTLNQLLTPDAMRGRVAAVNWVFVGSSNQLGGFESGLLAEHTSPRASVVIGGIGSIVVTLACAAASPRLRRLGPLSEVKPAEDDG